MTGRYLKPLYYLFIGEGLLKVNFWIYVLWKKHLKILSLSLYEIILFLDGHKNLGNFLLIFIESLLYARHSKCFIKKLSEGIIYIRWNVPVVSVHFIEFWQMLYNHQWNHDIKISIASKNFPLPFSVHSFSSYVVSGNHWSVFCHHVFPFLQFHMKGIIVFCIWHSSQSIILLLCQ